MNQTAIPKVPQCKFCNETPYLMAPMVGRGLRDGYSLTMVVKASYRLSPGETLIPMDPQVQFRGDEWIGEDFQGALHHGTDLVLWKPKSDVLMRATCFAPEGRPATTVMAGFSVDKWAKSVAVFGDRTWKVGLFERSPGPPQPFTSMPLDWEHAYGGPEFPGNPSGRGFRGDLLPNVELPDEPVRKYADKVTPAAFLPINRMWAKRMSQMGSVDGSYLKKRFPLPPGDFDWTYYNEAPDDQQLEHYLRGDEELAFSNLHPTHSAWTARLPGKRVRCFVEDTDDLGDHRVREVTMNCDTLFANLDEGYVHLLWRGITPIRSENRAEITKFYTVEESLTGPIKTIDQHLADMAVAADLGGKLGAKVKAEVAAIKKKTAGILARYGLEMPPEKTGIGPSDADLAAFPFNPHGPLPPSAARFQKDLDALAAIRPQGLDKLRAVGKEHAIDVDAVPAIKPVDLIAEHKKRIEGMIAQLEKDKQKVPDYLPEQLAKLKSTDPYGIATLPDKFKAAGIDLSAQGNAQLTSFSMGDTGAYLANLQSLPAASINTPLPGVTPDPTDKAAKPVPPQAAPGVKIDPAADSDDQPPATLVAPETLVFAEFKPRPAGGLDRESIVRFLVAGKPFRGESFYAADFSGLDLRGRDLSHGQFVHASFRDANLSGCTISTALLRHADFTNADLSGATIGKGDYSGADFSGAKLSQARFARVAFASCFFVGADLRGAIFDSVMMDGVNLSRADLRDCVVNKGVWRKCLLHSAMASGSSWAQILITECVLDEADFSHARLNDTVLMACRAQRLRLIEGQLKGLRAFNGTDLQGAVMVGANMVSTSWMYVRIDDADFSQGDMRGANLMFSSGIKARFVAANLKSAMLRHAQLEAADFHGANLCKASFGHANLTRADLSRSNCYQADFQDAHLLHTRFDEANMLRSNVPRG